MLGIAAGLNMFVVISGFFVKPLSAEFGWTRGQVSLSAGAIFVCSLLVPLSGAIADRRGARIMVAVGAVIFASCYLAFAMMTGSLWQYLAILAVIGLVCGPATMPFIFLRPVVAAFDRSRGFALAVAMTGFPLLSFALLPALQLTMATYGWRVGFLTLAPLSLLLGLASWLLLAHAPSKEEPLPIEDAAAKLAPAGSFQQAITDPRFWLLALALVGVNFSVGIFTTTLQPMLSDRGVDGRTAALLGVWQAVVTVVGRMSFGALIDRFWPPLVGGLAFAAPLFGLVIFLDAGARLPLLAAGIAMVAIAFGAETDLLAYFTSRYFGLRAFGAVTGALGLFYGVSFALGAVIAGFSFDRVRSYDLVLGAGAALSGVAAVAVFSSGLLRRR
jgi:MFS family permease